MSYQQVIAKKVKLNGLMGTQHHLIDRDRVKINPDIDLTRSRFNYFIENLTAENLNSCVKSRIKQLNLMPLVLKILLSKHRLILCSMLTLKLVKIIFPMHSTFSKSVMAKKM